MANDAYDNAVLGGVWPAFLGTSEARLNSIGLYWPFDDVSGGTVNGGNNYYREASGAFAGDVKVWLPFNGGFGVLAQPSILSMPGANTCMQKANNGSASSLSWGAGARQLTAPEKAVAAPTGAMTFCVWVLPTDILGTSNNGVNAIFGQFGGYNMGTRYEVLNIGGIAAASPDPIVPNGTFFLASTFDGSTSRVYVNGVDQGDVVTAGPISQGNVDIEVFGLLNSGCMNGYAQKMAMFTSGLTTGQIQNLYMIGAQTLAESTGKNLNVYPFSRQAIAANAGRKFITLTNNSDTAMFLSLGTTANPVLPNTGIHLPPNGGRYQSGAWKGAIQVCHGALLGSKILLIQEL